MSSLIVELLPKPDEGYPTLSAVIVGPPIVAKPMSVRYTVGKDKIATGYFVAGHRGAARMRCGWPAGTFLCSRGQVIGTRHALMIFDKKSTGLHMFTRPDQQVNGAHSLFQSDYPLSVGAVDIGEIASDTCNGFFSPFQGGSKSWMHTRSAVIDVAVEYPGGFLLMLRSQGSRENPNSGYVPSRFIAMTHDEASAYLDPTVRDHVTTAGFFSQKPTVDGEAPDIPCDNFFKGCVPPEHDAYLVSGVPVLAPPGLMIADGTQIVASYSTDNPRRWMYQIPNATSICFFSNDSCDHCEVPVLGSLVADVEDAISHETTDSLLARVKELPFELRDHIYSFVIGRTTRRTPHPQIFPPPVLKTVIILAKIRIVSQGPASRTFDIRLCIPNGFYERDNIPSGHYYIVDESQNRVPDPLFYRIASGNFQFEDPRQDMYVSYQAIHLIMMPIGVKAQKPQTLGKMMKIPNANKVTYPEYPLRFNSWVSEKVHPAHVAATMSHYDAELSHDVATTAFPGSSEDTRDSYSHTHMSQGYGENDWPISMGSILRDRGEYLS